MFPYVTCFGFSRQSHGWVFFLQEAPSWGRFGVTWGSLMLCYLLSAVQLRSPPLPVIGVGRVSALLLPSEGCDEVSHLAR